MIRKSTFLLLAGFALVLASLCAVTCNLREEQQAGTAAQEVTQHLTHRQEASTQPLSSLETVLPESKVPDYLLNPRMEMPVANVRGDAYVGTLEIPILGLNLPVAAQYTTAALKKSPCLWSGTVYQGNAILCGHNYRTHFGSLKKLHPGDALSFTDCDGNLFRYTVSEIQTLDGTDIAGMQEDDGWDLTLFTCTTGGRQRITIRCRLA